MSFMRIIQFGAVALLSTACGSIEPGDASFSSAYADCDDAAAFPELAGSQCAFIEAPLDHAAPGGETIDLFVRKFPAHGKAKGKAKGEVWLIAGGPGESGASYYSNIAFFRDAFTGYDIIVPDHRGTGYSTKICEPEETKDSPGGLALEGAEWGTCFGSIFAEPHRAHQFNQRNAAHDIDHLVNELGTNKKTFVYGVSYGTSLALEYAKLATGAADGIILDSLTPAPNDTQNDLSHRSHVANRVGEALLDRCSESPNCPLGRNANAEYQALLNDIDNGAAIAGLDAAPNGDLRQLLGLLLDAPEGRKRIPAIIRALADNDPGAEDLINRAAQDYEAFLQPIAKFEQAVFSIPLTGLISSSEFNARRDLTPETVAAEKSALGFTSPLPAILASNQLPLYEAPPAIDIARPLPPLLVLQGTLDPKTPYDAALAHAEEWKKHTKVSIVTVLDAPHAIYLSAQDCIAGPVSAFVADLTAALTQECLPKSGGLSFD